MQRTGKYTHKNEYCTKANDRLTAVKRKPDGLLDLGKVRLSARLPYGNNCGLRPAPQGTSSLDPYQRQTGLSVFSTQKGKNSKKFECLSAPSANDRLTAVGSKPGGLLMWGSYTPVGEIAFGKVSRAPPCTRKGHRPLTRISAELSFCLC